MGNGNIIITCPYNGNHIRYQIFAGICQDNSIRKKADAGDRKASVLLKLIGLIKNQNAMSLLMIIIPVITGLFFITGF